MSQKIHILAWGVFFIAFGLFLYKLDKSISAVEVGHEDPLTKAIIDGNYCEELENSLEGLKIICRGEVINLSEKPIKLPESLKTPLDIKTTDCYYNGEKAYMVLDKHQIELTINQKEIVAEKLVEKKEALGIPISCEIEYSLFETRDRKWSRFVLKRNVWQELADLGLYPDFNRVLWKNGHKGWIVNK